MRLTNSLQIQIILCILAIMVLSGSGALGSPADTANITNSTNATNATNSSTALDFPDKPLAVDDNNIDSLIKRYPLLVVDCWTPDCRPCQQISPTIDQMASDFKGKIVFGKLNIWYNFGTRKKYNVFHYPMLLMFKNGALVDKHLGNYPKEELESVIMNRLGPI
jgi:thioredoxin 1